MPKPDHLRVAARYLDAGGKTLGDMLNVACSQYLQQVADVVLRECPREWKMKAKVSETFLYLRGDEGREMDIFFPGATYLEVAYAVELPRVFKDKGRLIAAGYSAEGFAKRKVVPLLTNGKWD
jgi:hypothetical protein